MLYMLARNALRDHDYGSRCGIELLIKHLASPCALSRNKTPTPSVINHVKHS